MNENIVNNAWPEDLVRHAAAKNLIIFVGAGMSMESKNKANSSPTSWVNLLEELAKTIRLSENSEELRGQFDGLMQTNSLLDAAEIINFSARKFSRSQDLHQRVGELVDGPKRDNFPGNTWHDSLSELNPDVIVTTNYDKIIERATGVGYKVHDYKSDQIAGDVRRREPILLKIHGSVDRIENIILSRSDFARVRREGVSTFQVLQSLLLTRPALFLGYSFGDPDLQLVLENVFQGFPETPCHYALMQDSIPDYKRKVFSDCYGVNVITYPEGDYRCGSEMVRRLAFSAGPN